jgi:predicted branched-subunit amino acid permease
MRAFPEIAAQARLAWFLGFGLTSWVVAGLAALAGFYVAGLLDDHARAALLFVNPLYYALLLAADLDKPAPRRAIMCGSAAAGLTFILPSSAGLLAAGIIGGTIAFFWGRARGKR